MKCPSCGFNNIPGSDLCEFCDAALASIDVDMHLADNPLMHEPLSVLKPREAIRVGKHTSILDAVKKMNRADAGCVIITGPSGDLKGIVTERDILLRARGSFSHLAKKPVSEIMTQQVHSLTEETPIAMALNFMSVHRYRHIPVYQKKKEIGILSVRDVLRYLAKQLV